MPGPPRDHASSGHASAELGVFDALAEGPRAATEVAARCASHPVYTERLRNGCIACDLVEKVPEGRFANGRLHSEFLTSTGARSLANWVRFMGDCYRLGPRDAVWEHRRKDSGDHAVEDERPAVLGPELFAEFIWCTRDCGEAGHRAEPRERTPLHPATGALA